MNGKKRLNNRDKIEGEGDRYAEGEKGGSDDVVQLQGSWGGMCMWGWGYIEGFEVRAPLASG